MTVRTTSGTPPSTSDTFLEDMPDQLLVRYQQEGENKPVEMRFWGGTAWIGRLRFLRLHVNSKGVSEVHAKLEWNKAHRRWQLSDNNSTNGTKLNDERLKAGQKYTLSDGDVILVGNTCSLEVEVKAVETMQELLSAHAKACHQTHCEENEEAFMKAHRIMEDAKIELCEVLGLPEDEGLNLLEDAE